MAANDNMLNLAGNALPPEIARQQAEASRQQQLANLLTQQGTQNLPTGSMVSGHFVPTSPFQYLGQYGNLAAGNYLAGKATEESQKTAKALRDYYAQELQTYRKMQKENPEDALLFGANAYNPALSTTATKQLTQGPKWEKFTEYNPKKGVYETYVMDTNSTQPESTRRFVATEKPAISPAEALRLRDEGIIGGGGGGYGGAPVSNAPAAVGTSPVINNNAPVSVGNNLPSYAQSSLTLNPTANNLPVTPIVGMAGVSPKEQRAMRTEQIKKTQENVNNAYEVYKVAADINKLLPQAHGSGIGAGMGYLANMFGMDSDQNVADAQLKVLASRILMQVPRFQGPQSDKDVAVYKEAAGSLADPTQSIASRQAALQTIVDMNKKYAPELDWSFGAVKPTPVPTQQQFNVPKQTSPVAKPTLRWNPNTQSFE